MTDDDESEGSAPADAGPAVACPDCGESAAVREGTVHVLQGSCPGCGRALTLIQGLALEPIAGGTTAPAATSDDEEDGASGPVCDECGSALAIELQPGDRLQVSCPECGTSAAYVPEGAARARAPRAPRDEDRRAPADRGRAPGGRPCRECGGVLTFTSDAEGNLTGECASCGNRFTLRSRPRYGGGRSDFRGGGRRPYSGGGDRGSRYPPRGNDRGSGRRGERDRDRDDDDAGRRRRYRRS